MNIKDLTFFFFSFEINYFAEIILEKRENLRDSITNLNFINVDF
jgi:hypothetical protein